MIRTCVTARPASLPEASLAISWPMQNESLNGTGSVEQDDLSRFEGEGGREALLAELVGPELRTDGCVL